MVERHHVTLLRSRLLEPRSFIIVLTGPRQVGKTTIVEQAVKGLKLPVIMDSADDTRAMGSAWIEATWGRARIEASNGPVILVIDEIQKVPQLEIPPNLTT